MTRAAGPLCGRRAIAYDPPYGDERRPAAIPVLLAG